MTTILRLYVTLLSAILAGIINSLFCKSGSFAALKRPMDNYKVLRDNKRIFGDNKTWKGFFGYIFFNIIFSVVFGLIWKVSGLEHLNYFYLTHDNNVVYNVIVGALLGFAYALFELPNSFIKRRLDIESGKTTDSKAKMFFVFLDQADSIFGMALVVGAFYPVGIGIYILFVLVGAGTHILINMLLYFMHVRKNMF